MNLLKPFSLMCLGVLSAVCCVQFSLAEYPNLAVVAAPRDGYAAYERHLAIKADASKETPGVVFLGDSITEQWRNRGKRIWDEYFGELKPFNAGIGSDRTEHVLWRVQHGGVDFPSSPKVCVLLIGTNNTHYRNCSETPEYTVAGIKAIVDELSAKYPGMKILLPGLLPRGATGDDKFRLHNEKINELLSGLSMPNVSYVDISRAFLDQDGGLSRDISPDLLHFNETGYKIYAEAIMPELKKLAK